MDLVNFKLHEGLNALREKIGTHKFGYYELFNPDFHLKAEELEALDQKHLVVEPEQLHECVDHTLRYKNARVVYVTHQPAQADSELIQLTLHFAACEDFQHHSEKLFTFTRDFSWDDFRLLTYLSSQYEKQSVVKVASVTACPKCMQKLKYKGYDALKSRKEIYNQELIMRFSVEQFYENYIKYPVKIGETKD